MSSSSLSRRVLLALTLVTGCDDPERLLAACPTKCYTGPADTLGVGRCHEGRPLCDQDGEIIDCLDEVVPQPEVCDLQDHDCDGFVDDISSEGAPCGSMIGECRMGLTRCLDGFVVCDGQVGPSEEFCDGLDNDCDGATDEPSEDEEIVFCYDGPPDTVTRGICAPGVLQCLGGGQICARQQLPRPEVCNGVDDDCDGQVDEGTSPVRSNVVILLDDSGSMIGLRPVVESVFEAMESTWFDFWLFNQRGPDSRCHTMTSTLSRCPAERIAELPRLWRPDGGGEEPVYDVLYDIVTDVYPIEWSAPGVQRTILLVIHETDERSPSGRGLTEEDLAQVVQSPYVVITYALEPQRFDAFSTQVYNLGPVAPLTPGCN